MHSGAVATEKKYTSFNIIFSQRVLSIIALQANAQDSFATIAVTYTDASLTNFTETQLLMLMDPNTGMMLSGGFL